MTSGRRFFLRFMALLLGAFVIAYGIVLSVFRYQIPTRGRGIDLLPVLQGVAGEAGGFIIYGIFWMAIGISLVVYVFRRSASNKQP